MVKFSICIETLLTEYPFAERARIAAELGFPALEFWLPDEDGKDLMTLRRVADKSRIEIASMVVNSNAGDVGGSLVRAHDKTKYLKRLRKSIQIAQTLGCKQMITCSGNALKNATRLQQTKSMVSTLKQASKVAEEEGITLLLEPLNTILDHPGYFLDSAKIGFKVVKAVGSPSLKLVYDIYHMQIMEGNILQSITENIQFIGHIHCAGVPGRHEIDSGELNYRDILNKIDEIGYGGFIGLEYYPTVKSEESLNRTLNLGRKGQVTLGHRV
jgi:hydroxypyruvate isomerase